MPSRWSSVAGVVMLFHSPMSRMNSTLPDAVDGDSEPNTASWRRYHGPTDTANRATAPTAATNGIRAGRAGRSPNDRRARHRSHRNTAPRMASTSTPSLRDSVASPASSPASAKSRGRPRSPRAASHSDPATSGWYSEKLSGCAMYTNDRAGNAVSTPAAAATNGDSPASRAIAQASGAANAPAIANGSADAIAVGPRSQMNGTWTIEASGIQCALDAIGSTGLAGILPPTSAKIQTTSTLNPWPEASWRATST